MRRKKYGPSVALKQLSNTEPTIMSTLFSTRTSPLQSGPPSFLGRTRATILLIIVAIVGVYLCTVQVSTTSGRWGRVVVLRVLNWRQLVDLEQFSDLEAASGCFLSP